MPLFRLRTRGPEDLPYVQDGSAQNLVQDAGIFGQGWLFGRPEVYTMIYRRYPRKRNFTKVICSPDQ